MDGLGGGTAIRRWPEEGIGRIPNWVYTDPEIFARELDRIFGGPSWLYACLEAEIPNPGDFKRSRLGTREVVAVRGEDGAIRVHVNRCAHRSMQFCSANRGHVKEFMCPLPPVDLWPRRKIDRRAVPPGPQRAGRDALGFPA
jgi:anthranilate 1,2-dioxygenase large subunit